MKTWSSMRASVMRDKGSRRLRRVGAVVAAIVVGLVLTAGCLNRPVVEQDPQTSNIFVDQIRQTSIDKIDLLFVIDNSISMADKQTILSVAVPGLVQRLVNPDCVIEDEFGNVLQRSAPPCDENAGFIAEFNPVDDIHIGVITSSLGAHGGEVCAPGSQDFNETKNDRGRLLPTVRPEDGLPSDQGLGFLAWQGGQTGISQTDLQGQFTQHVVAAGEIGCGYEATLEAWYRFLIDPSPPLDMFSDGTFAYPVTDAAGTIIVDDMVLQQRVNFLRPDSLVAIIMLTDENDCSVVDGGIGWLTGHHQQNGAPWSMPSATAACAANPNDACCRSCGLNEAGPPSGCPSLLDDPGCVGRDPATDSLNLRCWDQKRRFGFDLLYPIERYVAGLTDPVIVDTHRCAGNECPQAQNPLYNVGGAANPRDPSLVFLAGIVGVPWQDIATTETLNTADLDYLTATEMTQMGRWDMILGDPNDPAVPPGDPLMIETTDPRPGTHPVTGQSTAPETSTDPQANAINGHEYVNNDSTDLQYACTFPLEATRDCGPMSGNAACDCTEQDLPKNRPLCNPPGGGPAGTMQYYAKAYPGTRLLQTLRDFGDNSIVASICPKVTTGDQNQASFGYNPAVAAIIERLKEVLGGRCLPRELVANEMTGLVPCAVVEATLTPNVCDPALGRSDVSAVVVPAVHKQLVASGSCGGATGVACESYYLCQINQLQGGELDLCQTQGEAGYQGTPGYCYVDPNNGIGSQQVIVGCPDTEPRKLEFVGDNTPASGSITFIACVGAAFTDDQGNANL